MLTNNFYEAILVQDNVHLEHVMPVRDFRRWKQTPVAVIASFQPVAVGSTDAVALRALLAAHPYQYFPVWDADRVSGIVNRRQLEESAAAGTPLPIAPATWLSPKASVREAERALLDSPANFVCLGTPEPGGLVGVLTLHDLLRGLQGADDDST